MAVAVVPLLDHMRLLVVEVVELHHSVLLQLLHLLVLHMLEHSLLQDKAAVGQVVLQLQQHLVYN